MLSSEKKGKSKMNKVVTLIGTLPPLKGNAYYCSTLAKELSKEINVQFIAFKKLYPNFLYHGGVKDNDSKFRISENENLKIERRITYYNPFSWIMAGIAAKGDVVHMQWWSIPLSPIFVVIMLILKMRGKKIILTVHNVIPHESTFLDRALTKPVFALSDYFIAHSDNNKKALSKMFKIKESRIKEIKMGVHDMYCEEGVSKEDALKQLGLEGKRVIINFGNIREYKGVDDLIEAFSIVSKKIKNSVLVIAGEPWIKWEKYDKLIERKGLKGRVMAFLKYVPMSKVNQLFTAAELVVLPYKKFDAQSGVGNIALAFKKPLIVTDVGGLPELVRDKNAVAKPCNPVELADKIVNVLNDRKLLNKMSKDSEILSKEFSWDNVRKETIEIYGRLENV